MKKYMILFALAIAPLLAAQLSAATGVSFGYAAIDDSVKDPWAKIIADIDRDGYADIIIGGRVGPLVWYQYPKWTKFIIAEGGYRTVDGEAGDIDGDGDADIVMGGLIWYENPFPKLGPGTPWKAHKIADHRTHDIELADLDKDGDLDIVTRDQSDFGTKAGDKVYLWRQDGGDKWTYRIIECPHGEGLALGDIDRDGDQDVVIGGIWYENSGSVVEGAWQAHKYADWHPNASVEVADINGDGRPDIVLAPSELKGNWYRLSWFEAPADPKQGGWAEHVIVERIECVVHGLATADFNGDRAVDIAASEMHQGDDPDEVVVFISRDRGAAWDKQVLSTKGSHCIQAGDIGSDNDIDLVGANWSGPYQPVEMWENKSRTLVHLITPEGETVMEMGAEAEIKLDTVFSGKSSSWHDGWQYRVPVRVGAAGADREARPVEVTLDFTKLLGQLGRTAPGNHPALFVAEVDRIGRVSHEITPVQFDKAPDYDPKTNLKGTLTFLLPDPMPAKSERAFYVYFDFRRPTAQIDDANSPVAVTDNIEHEGQQSFKIKTPNATYYYHKQGGGFASIEDRDGNDWLSYNPGDGPVSKSGSGGKYRGIPNMVHPEGYFHPGNDKSKSRLLSSGPLKATIVSESQDGKWACQWDIFPSYARLTVLKAGHPYWFLYEGTPSGKLDEDSDYCIRCDGTRTPANARWDGDIAAKYEPGEWLYFGDGKMSRVLYLIHEEDDGEIDSYWPMNHEMTVFGFGRQNLDKYMTLVPAHFTIGFCEKAHFAAVRQVVQSAYRPLSIQVGDPQARTQ